MTLSEPIDEKLRQKLAPNAVAISDFVDQIGLTSARIPIRFVPLHPKLRANTAEPTTIDLGKPADLQEIARYQAAGFGVGLDFASAPSIPAVVARFSIDAKPTFPIQPSLSVTHSKGVDCYWLIQPTRDVALWRRTSRLLAAKFGGSTGKALLPGTFAFEPGANDGKSVARPLRYESRQSADLAMSLQAFVARMGLSPIDLDTEILREFGAYSLDEFGEHYKPPLPLLDGVIGLGTVTVVSGPPGSRKTFWAIGLAAAVASGAAEFCGAPLFNTGRVLYAALEGQGVMAHRFRAYQQHYGVSVGDRLKLMGEGVSLRPDDDANKRLIDVCECFRPQLVILDTLSMAVAGADTDKEKDMAPAIKTANAIATHTGAAVVVIHHPPKAGGSSVRGSGTIIGNVDAVYTFERDDGQDADPALSVLDTIKKRWGRDPDPLGYRLVDVSLHARDGSADFETDERGVVVTSAVLVAAEAPSALDRIGRGGPSVQQLVAAWLDREGSEPDASGVIRIPLKTIFPFLKEGLGAGKTKVYARVNFLPHVTPDLSEAQREAKTIEQDGWRIWTETANEHGAPKVICARRGDDD